MDDVCQNIAHREIYEACCVRWRGHMPRRQWRGDSHQPSTHAHDDLLCRLCVDCRRPGPDLQLARQQALGGWPGGRGRHKMGGCTLAGHLGSRQHLALVSFCAVCTWLHCMVARQEHLLAAKPMDAQHTQRASGQALLKPLPALPACLPVCVHVQWSGSQGWSQAQDKPWKLGGKQVGEVTAFDTLSFVKVYQAVSTCIYLLSRTGRGCGCVGCVQEGCCLV